MRSHTWCGQLSASASLSRTLIHAKRCHIGLRINPCILQQSGTRIDQDNSRQFAMTCGRLQVLSSYQFPFATVLTFAQLLVAIVLLAGAMLPLRASWNRLLHAPVAKLPDLCDVQLAVRQTSFPSLRSKSMIKGLLNRWHLEAGCLLAFSDRPGYLL